MEPIQFSIEQLEDYCPFMLVLDKNWHYVFLGRSMQKILSHDQKLGLFADNFVLPTETSSDLGCLQAEVLMFRHRESKLSFKGRILAYRQSSGETYYLLLVHPMLKDPIEFQEYGLGFSDFALQDPLFDYLILIQSLRMSHAEALRMRDQAEQASRSKSLFVSNMSHEIRTPLHAILGYITLLQDELKNEGHQEMLGTIRKSGGHLIDIINDILDFSKIESGRLSLESKPLAIAELLRDIASLFAGEFQKKAVDFQLTLPADLHPVILGDATRLKQMLINLISNALKFTQLGHVKLKVEEEALEGPYARFHFSVIDTGIGIAEEKLGRIFEAFEQADSSSTRQFGGAGLGLAINRKLARLMGGDIEVKSREHMGSHFTLTIRAQKLNLDLLSLPAQVLPLRWDGFRKDIHVLLVEDNDVNQLMMSKILKKMGLRYQLADNGLEAVKLCLDQAFDLILMDLQMPVMDGVTATRTIRTHERISRQPIIFALTANNSPEDRAACERVGMEGFIPKPIQIEEFVQTVSQYFPLQTQETAPTQTPPPPAAVPLQVDGEMLLDIEHCLFSLSSLSDGSGFASLNIWESFHTVFEQLDVDIKQKNNAALTRHGRDALAILAYLNMRGAGIDMQEILSSSLASDWEACERTFSRFLHRMRAIDERLPMSLRKIS